MQIRIETPAYRTIDSDDLEFTRHDDDTVLTFDEWQALLPKEQKEWSWDTIPVVPRWSAWRTCGDDRFVFYSDDDKWTEFGRL